MKIQPQQPKNSPPQKNQVQQKTPKQQEQDKRSEVNSDPKNIDKKK